MVSKTPPRWNYLGIYTGLGDQLPGLGPWITDVVKCGPAQAGMIKDQSHTHPHRLVIGGHLFELRKEEREA